MKKFGGGGNTTSITVYKQFYLIKILIINFIIEIILFIII